MKTMMFLSALLFCGFAQAEEGIASMYWQPQKTGCPPYGQFDPNAMTAAHKTLPCGSKVRVTALSSGRQVIVRINDRGPYVRGRIIDLSRAAFGKIAPLSQGLVRVRVERIE